MDLRQLESHLQSLSESLPSHDKQLLDARLKALSSVFPFNEYEYALMFLLERNMISFAQYEELRNEYVSSNRYIQLYGLAPRVFGGIWAEEHIRDLDQRFVKPDKSLDPDYSGQYDLIIRDVRAEVKAARAINSEKRGDLVSKALRCGTSEPFWMNFQQIKLNICDVFVFVGVWVDQITYWVLSNDEVENNAYLSHQHRGGIEYQIGIKNDNLHDFDHFRVSPSELAATVIEKGKQ